MSNIQAQLRASIEADPRITPPPALGPPIIGPDTPGSAPGVNQPQYESGDANTPTAASMFPQAPVGTWMPPPQVGMGGNAPFSTPVVPPGSGTPGIAQPVYGSGSGTVPTAASLFPSFSAAGPFQPIVLTSIANTSLETSQNPTTPGTQPITMSTTPIPGLPWTQMATQSEALMTAPPKPKPEPEPAPEPEPEPEPEDDEAAHVTARRPTSGHVSKSKKRK